jgi:hypothetical protein
MEKPDSTYLRQEDVVENIKIKLALSYGQRFILIFTMRYIVRFRIYIAH